MAASMRSGHMRVETPEHKTKEKMKRKTKYSPSKEDSSLNRPKKMKQYFSEVDFKGMLKDPSTALSGKLMSFIYYRPLLHCNCFHVQIVIFISRMFCDFLPLLSFSLKS